MVLDEIISIKKIGIRKTLDIEIDGPDHLFFCNDILVHNSAAGETNDITEENIQGGISKIQSADNVLGFIPNTHNRTAGLMKAKFLKTRDSGGVGKIISFHVDWSTLTFSPVDPDSLDNDSYNLAETNSGSSTIPIDQLKKTSQEKSKIKDQNEIEIKTKNEEKKSVNNSRSKTVSIIKKLGGKKKPFGQKKVKLI